jgi:integrase
LASIRLHNGRWQVREYGPDGKLHGVGTYRTKTEAKNAARDLGTDKGRGIWIDPELGKVRCEQFAEDWLAATVHLRAGSREKVAGHLRTHIVPAFRGARLNEIRPADVRAWISELSSKRAPGTVIAVYPTFSKMMKTATIEGRLLRSPCIGIDLPRDRRSEMRFLTPEQVARLVGTIDERYSALVYFAAYSGLRYGEIAALRIERANLLRGSIDVVESLSEINGRLHVGPTKTGARRTVSLPRFLCQMLGEHIARFPSSDGRLFSAAEGGPLRRNFYRRHFRPAVERAGLAPLRFHDLRHTCASLLIAQGAHAKEISERLGHSTARLTLDRYGHLLPSLDERLRDGLEATFQAVSRRPVEARRSVPSVLAQRLPNLFWNLPRLGVGHSLDVVPAGRLPALDPPSAHRGD